MRLQDVVPPPTLERARDVVVVEAHPDDAEVWAGATLAWLARRGARIHLLSLTDGGRGTRDPHAHPQEVAAVRAQEAQKAARLLGAQGIEILGEEDMLLENTPAVRGRVVSAIRRHRADTLFALDPFLEDESHPDHRAAGNIALAAALLSPFPLTPHAQGGPHALERVVLYATSRPNLAVDVSGTWEVKWQAVAAHASQFPPEELEPLRAYLTAWCQDYGQRHGAQVAEPLRLLHPAALHMNPGDSSRGLTP
jgi:LmbE family N-acetylglucosaminyl deacetylase